MPTGDRRGVFLSVLVAVLLGAAAGLGLFTVGYANAFSYLRDAPKACANCHAMQGHLDAWVKSSHGKFATCNDCHAPHDSVANQYYAKAKNGFFHSLAFTTGEFEDNLRITEFNRKITEAACRQCHAAITHLIDPESLEEADADALSCIQCHNTVGHDS